jgi:hypothetical protein
MPAFAGMSGDWFAAFPHPLIPAKAGIQPAFRSLADSGFGVSLRSPGMTEKRARPE